MEWLESTCSHFSRAFRQLQLATASNVGRRSAAGRLRSHLLSWVFGPELCGERQLRTVAAASQFTAGLRTRSLKSSHVEHCCGFGQPLPRSGRNLSAAWREIYIYSLREARPIVACFLSATTCDRVRGRACLYQYRQAPTQRKEHLSPTNLAVSRTSWQVVA